jgi:uncharacterized protein
MSPLSGFFRQRYLILLLYLMVALPWIIYGAVTILKSSSSSPLDWVENRYPPRENYETFRSLFGDGDVLIASWQGCRIDDARLDQLRDVLLHNKAFRSPSGDSYFDTVQSGRDALEHLLQPPFQIPFTAAAESLQGVYIGKDLNDTLFTIQFNAAGLQQRNRLVPLIQRAITKTCGVSEQNIWLSGPVMDGFTVDAASTDTMQKTAPLSAAVVLCLCILCVESPFAGVLLFLLSLLAQAISLALVYYSGASMTALLIVLPPLMQVISVAGGMHLIHYYFAALRPAESDFFEIAAITIRENWVPFSLSAITTAIGMFSLALSQVSAVRDFGILAGISVIVNWGIVCFFLPGALATFRIGRKYHQRKTEGRTPLLFQILFRLVSSHASMISITALLTMLGLGIGLPSLNASVRIETLFAPESALVQSYSKTEESVGPLVPLELAITFPQDASWSYQRKVDLIRRVTDKLSVHPQIDRVFSGVELLQLAVTRYLAINAVPTIPEIQSEAKEAVLSASLPGLINMHYLARDSNGREVWRITSLTSALGDTKYNELLAELDSDVRQSVGYLEDQSESIHFRFAGIMPLVHNIQQQLLDDLFSSFLSAFAVIFAILALSLGSFAKAAIAMIPNLFPVILLFGALGWSGKAIDIGTIMTASIAIGIAVDDTLHFLTMYEKVIASSLNRSQAIRYVYEHCGMAILNTTIVCVFGMAVFSLNSFIPTARFSWMMAGLLALAVVGDLILLPALLLSPLGHVFVPKLRALPTPSPSTESQIDP